jgi:pimeloyl-ACP methyl ester carboxylesterase
VPDRTIAVNGLSFHVVDEGEGPPVILLHGFPDSAYLWRHQIAALAAAGHRVVAPDLRGFGASDRPEKVEQYGLLAQVADITGIMDALDLGRAGIVGHDWGAALAWLMGIAAPDRVERLVAISVGHPGAFRAAGIPQREKSWYMLAFQFVGVAEDLLSRDDFAFLRAWTDGQGGDVDRWVHDLSRPGALTAALNWYRANVPAPALLGPGAALPPVGCDVLGIWSDHDMALTETQMAASAGHVTGSWRMETIAGIGHWIPTAAPDRLNELLIDFLG